MNISGNKTKRNDVDDVSPVSYLELVSEDQLHTVSESAENIH